MNKQIKDTLQDCNLNFLLGSGLSCPYLVALGNIETLLNELHQSPIIDNSKNLIRASLYKKYFDGVIVKNLKILQGHADSQHVLENYKNFLTTLNSILLRRKSTILSKEVNLFTTNIDIFLEKALEELCLEFNDGFNGRFRPSFDLNNFKKSRFKKSLHYDNAAEIPVFNLLKLHGALTWTAQSHNKILFSSDLAQVDAIERLPPCANILDVPENATIATLDIAAQGKIADATIATFVNEYDRLAIVNPTIDKFRHTLLNLVYYELLRLYANELEKENTVLFTMGFSFADAHIREITLRAANSNPTLIIYVIAYNSTAKKEIASRFPSELLTNKNIIFIAPPQEDKGTGIQDKFEFDLANINKEIFGALFKQEDEAASPPVAPSI